MPTYSLPTTAAPVIPGTDRDPTREMASKFLTSPQAANIFMAQAQQAMAAREQGDPPPDPDGPGKYAGGGSYTVGDIEMDDANLLARAIAAEAAHDDRDRRGVASVIMNRVDSPNYPNTVRDVILQPGHFSAFNNVTGFAGGKGSNTHWRGAPDPALVALARNILSGGDRNTGALNYYNHNLVTPNWTNSSFAPLYAGGAHVYGDAS